MDLSCTDIPDYLLPVCTGYFRSPQLFRRHWLRLQTGVLVKGSNYLEALSHAEIVVMDKTGTLTEGKFHVTQQNAVGISEAEQLELAALAESASNHPIGSHCVRHTERNWTPLVCRTFRNPPAMVFRRWWTERKCSPVMQRICRRPGWNRWCPGRRHGSACCRGWRVCRLSAHRRCRQAGFRRGSAGTAPFRHRLSGNADR